MSEDQPVHIDTAPPEGEQQRVAALLAPFAEMFGRAPDGLRLLGISPSLLEGYIENIGYYLEHPKLSRRLLAFVRYLVSRRAGCRYCVGLNQQMLLGLGLDIGAIQDAAADPGSAPLEPTERALLQFVLAAVEQPGGVDGAAVGALRDHGWSDRDIFDAVYHGHGSRAFGNVMETFNLHAEGVL